MKISVIVPVYNAENYVIESINSTLAQKIDDLEIIAINDGSTDSSPEKIATFGDRIKVIHQPNLGVSASLNNGLKIAKGEYIAFIDADDIWEPGKLQKQIQAFKENPEIDLVFGKMQQFLSPELTHISDRFRFEKEPVHAVVKLTCLARREVFETYGLFPDTKAGLCFIDWLATAKTKGIRSLMLDDLLAKRRIRLNSLSQDNNYLPSLLKLLKSKLDARRHS